MLPRAWQDVPFSWTGDLWQVEDRDVQPKALQQPHPPVWVASGSPDAIAWSASQGFSILMDPHASHQEIAAKRALYQQELEAAGYSIDGRDIPMARNIALGRTQAEAEAIARKGAEFMFGSYLRKPDAVRNAQQQKTMLMWKL